MIFCTQPKVRGRSPYAKYTKAVGVLTVSLFISQVADLNGEFFLKSSELFESPVYLEEVADVLCILQAGTQL